MIKQALLLINALFLLLAILLIFLGISYWWQRPNEFLSSDPADKKRGLPKNAFEYDPSSYQKIDKCLFKLEECVPTLQVPDLRQHLIYYGRNSRPDADLSSSPLHFAFNANNRVVATVEPGKPLYLFYDRKINNYTFSQDNKPTTLWIVATPMHLEVHVRVYMQNEQGEIISYPEYFANFRSPEKEFARVAVNAWEIGGHRVDGTILARQRARWYGIDQFLDDHGGKEFSDEKKKQRIDFGDNEDLYSVFVGLNDVLIWENGRWKAVKPGPDSIGRPLLIIKKIDDRLMTLEIWDNEGKAKLPVNLLKSVEPWGPQNLQILEGAIKFIGAKTRKQSVFEINRERMVLNPSDWLLYTSKGWKKLSSEQEIDDYVSRKLTGPLFVFDGIERKEEKQFMIGTLYSPSRNEAIPVEIPLQATLKPKAVKEKKVDGKKETKEERETQKEVTKMLQELLTPGGQGEGKGSALEQIRNIKQAAIAAK